LALKVLTADILKIVIVTGGEIEMPPKRGGGAEAYIFNLSKKLAQFGNEVINLERLSTSSKPVVEEVEAVKIIRLNAPKFSKYTFTVNFTLNQIAFAFASKKFLERQRDVDIVYVYTSIIAFLLLLTSKSTRKKLVYFVNGSRRTKKTLRLVDWLALALENRLCKQVKKIVIANEAIARHLIRTVKLGEQKVVIIPVGVDIEKFNPYLDISLTQRKYALEGKINILFVGRICADKGVEYLIKASQILIDRLHRRDIQVLLVGPAEQFSGQSRGSNYFTQMISLAANLGLRDYVKFLGNVHVDELRNLYAASDMVVIPSVADLDPQVQIEAMASGKPVIGTKVGTIPFRIKHGYTGLLVDPANEQQLAESMEYLVNYPQEAEKMGWCGQQLVKAEYTSDIMAERILGIFKEIAEKDSLQ
jgi:D-inositol-3-phosphate glycosyltransferase